ncbi:MAG: 50S ribosomal protein L25 [Bdellovibrio sp. 28-41-41]|nr:MAG: 50S ribosomal protein L25 [Bdellovibrio sp. 28-41-41]
MKQRHELTVEPRGNGKHNNRALRKSMKVPGVIYGAITNVNISMAENDVIRFNSRKFDNALFTLKSSIKDANGKVVLIKSVDIHPLTRRPVHADLYALDLTKTVRVSIEIKTEGRPAGLSEGGLLSIVNRTVEIEVLPTDIPDSLTVDVSHLGVGESVHVSELKLPPGVKMMSAADLTLAVVNTIEEEAAATPAVAAAAATPAAGAPAAAAPAAGGKPAAGAKAAAAPAKDAKAPAKK